MKTYHLTITILLALALGCSGGSDGNDNESTEDVTSADGTGTTDAGAGDVATGDDSVTEDLGSEIGPADAGDETVEDTVEPEESLSADLLTDLCQEYCDDSWGCDGFPYGEDCVDECLAKGQEEPGFGIKLLCSRDDEEGDDIDYCATFEGCTEEVEFMDECGPMCEDVAECNALAGPRFGYTPYDCRMVCSVGLGTDPDAENIAACVAEAVKDCSGTAFISCVGDQPAPCVDHFCVEDASPDCLLIPEPYEDVETCNAVCEPWSSGQSMAAEMCAEAATDWPADCTETLLSCQAPPAELPEGALNYCAAMNEKCEGLVTYMDGLGTMGDEICGWFMTGFTLLKPDLFQPFTDGLTCVENLEVCPSGDMSSLYCLFNIPDEAKTRCQKVKELCTPEDYAAEMVIECEAVTAFVNAFMADQLQGVYACMDNAADCETLENACFLGGEE